MGLRLVNQEYGEYFFVTTSFVDRRDCGNQDGVYGVIAEALNFRAAKTDAKILESVYRFYLTGRSCSKATTCRNG
jgi:hypothetical protein